MSNDTTTTLNQATTVGDVMDESLGVGGTTKRPRVVVGGDTPGEGLAKVRAADPATTDEGLVVRGVDAAKETTISNRFGKVSKGTPQLVNTTGPTTLYTPAAGKSIRLKWLGIFSPETNTAAIVATVTLGTTDIYQFPLGTPGAFVHGFVREGGINETLTITLSASGQPVYCNFDCEEF